MTNLRLIILIFLSFCSCQNDKFIVLKPSNDTIQIKKIVLNRHKNTKGYLENYFLELEDYTKIKKEFIPEFQISINDSVFNVQGINLGYNRDKIVKDFYFLYNNQTKRIHLDTIQNNEMLILGPGKRYFDTMNWVKTEMIID